MLDKILSERSESKNRGMAQLGLRRYLGVVEIVGSNPAAPILFRSPLRIMFRRASENEFPF